MQRDFNGFGQLVEEWQEADGSVDSVTLSVGYGYSTSDNHSRLVTVTYPNGRTVDRNYTGGDNAISRLSSLSDGSVTLEGYSYLGLGTVVERSLTQANVALKYHAGSAGGDSNDIYQGLDRFGRITRQLWWDAGDSSASVDFRYGYDESSNRLYREDKTNDSITVNFGELYGYDGLNQLVEFGRGELNETYSGLDKSTRSQDWTPDALGNFNNVTTTVTGSSTTSQNRTHDGRNQLLTVGSSTLTYDNAGSMTTDETGRTFTYDAWNRLMSSSASSVTVNKKYDALNRRVVDGAKTLLYSDQWQVLEERDRRSTVRLGLGTVSWKSAEKIIPRKIPNCP